jgi:hypothetical protein
VQTQAGFAKANSRAQVTRVDMTKAFGWRDAPRYIIRDRDGVYGEAFTQRVRAMGIRDRPI